MEFPNLLKKTKNAMCLVICNFIACVWYNRDGMEYIEEIVISRTLKKKRFIMNLLKDKAKDILCKKYCEISREKLNSFKYI